MAGAGVTLRAGLGEERVEAGQAAGPPAESAQPVGAHHAGGRAFGARRRRVRAAGQHPDAGEEVVAVEQEVGGVDGTGGGRLEEEDHGGGEVVAVDLGGDARGDLFAAQVGGEEVLPLVRTAAVDTGGAQRDAARAEGRLGGELDLAVERVGIGWIGLAQDFAAAAVAVDGAAGEKDDVGVAGRVEEGAGAVEVQAAEIRGIVALAAAVGAGDMGERRVDESVGRRQERRGVGEDPKDGRRGAGRGW